ncbi:beta-galactosidase trimerization domain-containing protein [Actinomyces ruminis]|uniref:beta-galactosidase trimerization domain-containing protein n=1 Tax=Actinomyces ruminis TaxID=1937003 RepID=UPI00211ED037|nr:beta-galactosidase trimerization domain-containing protein [Actinomyces ruminis]
MPARAAVVFDYESWWSLTQEFLPHTRLDYRGQALDWYRALVAAGLRVDVVTARNDLEGYDLVVAPLLHVMPADLAERLCAIVAGGSHLVTTYFSGTVDEHDHVILGGYPGALRELLGIRVEEFGPLLDGDHATLSGGAIGRMWTERVDTVDPDVRVLRRYERARGIEPGTPAVTRRTVGAGSATYVSTRLEGEGLAGLVEELLAEAGIEPDLPESLRGQAIASVRRGDAADYWTLTNRGNRDLGTAVDVAGMLGETVLRGAESLGASDAVVVRVPRG